jgi:hypothetical protein
MRRTLVLGLFMLLAGAAQASAQLPIQFSFNGGLAMPLGNEKDIYDNGFHVGVGLKAPLIPIQLEGAYDRLNSNGENTTGSTEDLSILSGGLALTFGITPPLLPVGAYVIAGGGLYRTKAETTATDFGVNGGVGVRVGIPGISLFGEGRGVLVLDEVSRRSYATVALGVRF